MVVVNGEVIDGVVADVESRLIPIRKMLHKRRGGSTNARLDGRVDPLHRLRGLVDHHAVGAGILVPGAKLPRTVHLIAEIPRLHAVRLLVTVLDTQVGPVRSARKIRVLHAVHRVLRAAGAHIYRIKGTGADLLSPLQILIVADLVGDHLVPRRVEVHLPLRLRADGILPLPSRNEVAAGQADRRKPGLFERVDDVGAEALLIRRRMLRVEHRAVHHRADGLEKCGK